MINELMPFVNLNVFFSQLLLSILQENQDVKHHTVT